MLIYNDLKTNKGLLLIILGVGAVGIAGGLTAIYAVSDSNQTDNQTRPEIKGSINLQDNIMSSIKTSFLDAAQTAESSIGNGKIIGGSLTVIQGSVVYQFKVMDNNNMVYSIIVDAGDGAVLYKSGGKSMTFGGFGFGGNCPMGGHHGWNKHYSSPSTDSSDQDTNPTYYQNNPRIESSL